MNWKKRLTVGRRQVLSEDTLQQQAYRYIHERILTGHLHSGSVVSEASLAKEIGVSRTPVREAIRQLQIEGLVQQVPRYGTVVRSPDREEIIEMFQLREALESYAVFLASQFIDEETLHELEDHCEQLQEVAEYMETSGVDYLEGDVLKRFLAEDMAFHTTLIRASRNSRIVKIVHDSHVLTRIFSSHRQQHDLSVVRDAAEGHRAVYNALRSGDGEAAKHLMAWHIRHSRGLSVAAFDKAMLEKAEEGPHEPPELLDA